MKFAYLFNFSLTPQDEEELCNFSIHPSSKFMATFTRNNMLRFVNLETKEVVHSWKVHKISFQLR